MTTVFACIGMEHVEYESYQGLSKEESDDRIRKSEWDGLASPAFTTIQNLLRFMPPGKTSMIRKYDRYP